MNPNDSARDSILRSLYERHRKAKSPKSAGIGIKDLQAALRPLGYKQQDVGSNLDYLIQKGWAVEQVDNRTFTTPAGTTQVSEKRTYKISDVGIDKLEAASAYQRTGLSEGINITTIGGVTVVGDGNVVNTSFTDLSRGLADMRTQVLAAEAVADAVKLNIAADIDALQSQLQKPEPNRAVVRALWTGIESAVTASGFVELVEQVGQLLGPLLG